MNYVDCKQSEAHPATTLTVCTSDGQHAHTVEFGTSSYWDSVNIENIKPRERLTLKEEAELQATYLVGPDEDSEIKKNVWDSEHRH